MRTHQTIARAPVVLKPFGVQDPLFGLFAPVSPVFTEASLNLADDEELMQLMIEAGFNKVFIGLETPIEASLAECNKFLNEAGDMVAAVKKIQNHGMQVLGGFIVGFDNDPPSIFESQIHFIQEMGVVTAMVGILTALPNKSARDPHPCALQLFMIIFK